jgi:hypothetical protein
VSSDTRIIERIMNPATGRWVKLPKPVVVTGGDLNSFVAGYQQRLTEEAQHAEGVRRKLRRLGENIGRAVWIRQVEDKLRHALTRAAEGKDFDWYDVQIGPDLDPDPTSYLWPPDVAQAWPEPLRHGFPPLPGPDATFGEIKRYANVTMYAEAFLQYDEDFRVPAELRLSEVEAWRLAEDNYDRLHANHESDPA